MINKSGVFPRKIGNEMCFMVEWEKKQERWRDTNERNYSGRWFGNQALSTDNGYFEAVITDL